MGSVLLLWLALSASQPGPAGPDTVSFNLDSHDIVLIQQWRFRDGDDGAWADPRYDDAAWPVVDPNRLDDLKAGVHWLRARVDLTGEPSPDDVLVLRFSNLPGAFEVYWDGSRVGANGRVGRGLDEEITGRVATLVKLPRPAAGPSRHLLGIRFSNFHVPRRFRTFWAVVAYHVDLITTRARGLHIQYFHAGIFLISTFVGLSLFLGGGRHRAFLLFAVYCLLSMQYWAVNPLNEIFNFDIRFFQVLSVFGALAFLSPWVLLNAFFVIHFKIPREKIHIFLILMLPLAVDAVKARFLLGLDWRDTFLALYGLGLLAYAWKHKRTGSLIALAGTLALSFPILYGGLNRIFPFLTKPDELIFLLASLVFVPCIILSISRQIREQDRLLEAARSRSHRLETELLKSRIQPHYISNTLHSIKSWFRENPQRADRMIQALSDEFKIINANSSKALIPLAEEVRLCRNHLEIMGSRRDVQFELDADGLPPDETIPPLVLHTLIENGITHAYGPRESGRFRLRVSADGRNVVYTLSNDGSRLREWADKGPAELGEGMGLAYVQARLEESFPGRWSVDFGLKGEAWEVTIRIRR
jgi:two-component sensor histidine kinase